jgi:branched-chain amino acid transport system ATP-binding protein
VRENLLLAARKARSVDELDTQRLEWLFGLFPALKKFWLYPAGKLSGGQKQMLAISRAMIEPRRLLLIDEPSKGLAPAIVRNLIEALNELKKDSGPLGAPAGPVPPGGSPALGAAQRAGTTVLLVEQNFMVAKALGDQVAVMDDGRVVHAGAMAELAEDEDLQQKLLGLSLGAHQ